MKSITYEPTIGIHLIPFEASVKSGIPTVPTSSEKERGIKHGLSEIFDHEDPEYISLEEAFHEICKKHGLKPANIAEYNEETKALHEILTRLKQLEKTNNAILNHYNGDKKFAYVHKRIREENKTRESIHKAPIISKYDEDIVKALTTIKATIDEKFTIETTSLNKMIILNER